MEIDIIFWCYNKLIPHLFSHCQKKKVNPLFLYFQVKSNTERKELIKKPKKKLHAYVTGLV